MACVEAGADAVGVNFVAVERRAAWTSRRRARDRRARWAAEALVVGVVADSTSTAMRALRDATGRRVPAASRRRAAAKRRRRSCRTRTRRSASATPDDVARAPRDARRVRPGRREGRRRPRRDGARLRLVARRRPRARAPARRSPAGSRPRTWRAPSQPCTRGASTSRAASRAPRASRTSAKVRAFVEAVTRRGVRERGSRSRRSAAALDDRLVRRSGSRSMPSSSTSAGQRPSPDELAQAREVHALVLAAGGSTTRAALEPARRRSRPASPRSAASGLPRNVGAQAVAARRACEARATSSCVQPSTSASASASARSS